MTNQPSESERAALKPKRRRWLKRLLIALGVLVFVLVLLIVALPGILTSQYAEKKVSKIASEKLGRPVEVSGLELGWRTPLKLGRVALPPVEGEEDYPFALLKGVSVPISILDLKGGTPLSLGPIRIEHIEANLVRLPDGEWNLTKLMNALDSGEPKEEPEEEESETAPGPFALADLDVKLERIDLRVIDSSLGFRGGLESGMIQLTWPGGTQPLTADLAGVFFANEVRVPWDVRAKVERWIGPDSVMTPMHAAVTISSDGMVHAGQIEGGGFFIHADTAEDSENSVRLVLPVDVPNSLYDQLPQEYAPTWWPDVDGTLDWQVDFKHANEFKYFDASTRLVLTDAVYPVEGLHITPQNISLDVKAKVDLENMSADMAEGVLEHEALRLAMSFDHMDFANVMGVQGFGSNLRVDFEKATRATSVIYGGPDKPMLTGSMDLDLDQNPSEPGLLALAFGLDLEPERFFSAEPFAELPVSVPQEGINLRPLAISTRMNIDYRPEEGSVALQTVKWENPLVPQWGIQASYSAATSSGSVRTAGHIDLGLPLERWSALLPAETPIPDFQGMLEFRINADMTSPTVMATNGSLAFWKASIRPPDIETTFDIPRTELAWDLRADLDAPRYDVKRLTLGNNLFSLGAEGEMTESIDFDAYIQADAGALMDYAKPVFQAPGEIEGVLRIDATAQGVPSDSLGGTVTISTPTAFSFDQPGTVTVALPIDLVVDYRVAWNEGELASAEAIVSTGKLGDYFDIGLESNIALGEVSELAAELTWTINWAPLLGMIDPGLLEQFDTYVALEGQTEIALGAEGSFVQSEEGMTYPEPWPITLEIVTEFPVIEWAYADFEGVLEGFADERVIEAILDPGAPMEAEFVMESVTGMDGIEGPMGLEAGSWELAMVAEGTPSRVEVLVDPFILEFVTFEQEGFGIELPSATFSAQVTADLEKQQYALDESELSIGQIVSWTTAANFDGAEGRWGTETSLRIDSIPRMIGWTILPLEFRDLIPEEMTGATELRASIAGTLPPEDWDPAQSLPLSGEMSFSIEDFAVTMPGLLVLEDWGLDSTLTIDGGTLESELVAATSIGSVVNPALNFKPATGIQARVRAAIEGIQSARVQIEEARLGNYGTQASGSLSLSGFANVLADDEREGLDRLLAHVEQRGHIDFRQDFADLTSIHPLLRMSGTAEAGLDWKGVPNRSVEFDLNVGVEDTNLAFGELMTAEGVRGSWHARKTYRAPGVTLRPQSPPEGVFEIESAAVGIPGMMTRLRDGQLRLRGLNEGVSAEFSAREFMGGNIVARASLESVGGDPLLLANVQTAGVDAGTLGGLDPSGDPNWEINGAAWSSWRLRPVDLEQALSDISFNAESTRVGRKAIARLLEAMDANQDDPRFQNARMALNFATAANADATMENGLVTFGVEIGTATGARFSLPIVDRQPLGDVLEVYQFDAFSPLYGLSRTSLVLLLAEDFETVEQEIQAFLEAPE